MEKNAHYFVVGLFAVSLMAGITAFFIWLAGPHEKKNYAYYTIYFTDSVSGLEEGADVEYKGVKAGKVFKMRLTPGRPDLVKVDIGVNKDTPVRAGTRAVLEMEGITGLVRLELSTDPGDLRPPAREPGEPYPVLAGTGTQLSRLLETLPAVADRATSSADAVRDAARSVRGLSESLKENPSRIIYQPATRGVRIPE
jgi:phospholipid/cholesterol/gamma-HCH transport system substrate-binding protein